MRFRSKGRQRSVLCGLKAIETNEDKLGESFEAAGKNALRFARGNYVSGMPKGIGTAGAGIRDDGGVTAKTRGSFADRESAAEANSGRLG